jgi:tripartite-type tricarboxylate transporter receptor subunit TctC
MRRLRSDILLSFDTLPEHVETLRAGRLRAYAIAAAARAPSVPTMAEAGLPGLLAANWMGVTARLHAEVAAAMRTAMAQERLAAVGVIGGEMAQPEFIRFVAGQIDTMGAAVRAMGIRNG